MSAPILEPGLILRKGDPGSWDDRRVSGPVVRFWASRAKYYMWYYGQSEKFFEKRMGPDAVSFPAGFIGAAVSEDLIHWTKLIGPLEGGAVFGPSLDSPPENAEDSPFDGLCVGIGDIIIRPDDSLEMYYFGGNDVAVRASSESVEVGTRGLRMRIGKATSLDGLNWTRDADGVILKEGLPGEFDHLFVSWPIVIQDEPYGITGPRYLLYHTLNPYPEIFFMVGGATSNDCGKTWEKTGRIFLEPFGDPSVPSSGSLTGHGGRSIITDPTGTHKFLMFIEGNNVGRNCIGLYVSDDGINWDLAQKNAIIQPTDIDSQLWDSGAIGTPCAVIKNNRYFIFYVGFPAKVSEVSATSGIGLVVSDHLNYADCKWTRVEPTLDIADTRTYKVRNYCLLQ